MPSVPPSAAYADYMRLPELLSLRRPQDQRVHPDEGLFQTVHQVNELLLSVAVEDITRAIAHLGRDQPSAAERLLARAVATVDATTGVLRLLGRLTLHDYHVLRPHLGTSTAAASPAWQHIRRALTRLDEVFGAYLVRADVDIVDVYRSGEPDPVHRLAETMIDLDSGIALWRFHHHLVAARLIGSGGTGTGGMPVDVLATAIGTRAFAMLWQVRLLMTHNGTTAGATQRGGRP
ncbi:tryptophan 2,3-dioxygenase [Hamadaea flava]|uniref:Tryptophan 2,3-dioxygenase n=1 Tax=Hamadaea flava TaxID=1742688 RepID=A0ABV8LLJ9_9ACTN|nr:tryptophan 2,3-dioxygenase [Hamadaea flava]MCP2323614.1 tryptophan 2,3-dioxygenase [Hamadaea flava]